MKRSRFSEEQIIAILKEQESGVSVADLCRKHGVSDASIYKWKAKFGGMDVSETRRLRTLVVMAIQAIVTDMPSYGYRRVWAMLRRVARAEGRPAPNHKRVYRVMKAHGLLLQRHVGGVDARRHDGRIVVDQSNLRWCSDGFELGCDNGSGYIAGDTRRFAREIGFEPLTTPVQSPQSNGMAEAFVRTIKRDYARVNPMPSAEIVMRQLPVWFDHYNRLHPRKALGYRSPREFIADRSTAEDVSGL